MPTIPTSLGAALRYYRERNHLSLRDVGRELGKGFGNIADLEYDLRDVHRTPSPKRDAFLVKIARVVKAPTDYLFYVCGNLPPDLRADQVENLTPEAATFAFDTLRALLRGGTPRPAGQPGNVIQTYRAEDTYTISRLDSPLPEHPGTFPTRYYEHYFCVRNAAGRELRVWVHQWKNTGSSREEGFEVSVWQEAGGWREVYTCHPEQLAGHADDKPQIAAERAARLLL